MAGAYTTGIPGSMMSGALPPARRRIRRPQHRFYMRTVPYGIHPFFISPVRPGETMQNLLMQSRAVTEPLDNPLIGWWLEYYFFYVKHRDLDIRDELTNMMLDPNFSAASITALQPDTDDARRWSMYTGGAGTIDFVYWCTKRCIEEYFRDEGVAWDFQTVSSINWGDGVTAFGVPLVSQGQNSWTDSLVLAADFGGGVPGPAVDIDGSGTITADELEPSLRAWHLAMMFGSTQMSYEDYLQASGVRRGLRQEDSHRPELIRFIREWTYPTNTIDPTSGVPRSAASWSVTERADKARYFSEPGFILGLSVCRPKGYFNVLYVNGSPTSRMNTLQTWLPPYLAQDPGAGYVAVPNGEGPATSLVDADGYLFDMRDLFEYGDQHVVLPVGSTEPYHEVNPGASTFAYAGGTTAATINNMFVTARATDLDYIRQDGVVTLSISTDQRDPFQMRPVAQGVRPPS